MLRMTAEPQAKPDLHPGQIAQALLALRDGNFSVRLPADLPRYSGMVARTFSSLAMVMEEFAKEQIRVTQEVGSKGDYGGQAEIFGIYGRWRDMQDSINRMGVGLTVEIRRTSQYLTKLLNGENPGPLKGEYISGEFAELQEKITALAQRLTASSSTPAAG